MPSTRWAAVTTAAAAAMPSTASEASVCASSCAPVSQGAAPPKRTRTEEAVPAASEPYHKRQREATREQPAPRSITRSARLHRDARVERAECEEHADREEQDERPEARAKAITTRKKKVASKERTVESVTVPLTVGQPQPGPASHEWVRARVAAARSRRAAV
eukprot:6534757-Prymnesium_polylepis.1